MNNVNGELSALAEIERDGLKTQEMKRNGLLRKYNRGMRENLDSVIEKLEVMH
jgi:hypothetical protein